LNCNIILEQEIVTQKIFGSLDHKTDGSVNIL
jgi:hypothetical protein